MDLLVALTLLTLSVFLGVELISKVPPTLHTPLMSGSNAISGITLIGAVTATTAGVEHHMLTTLLGTAAVTLAMVNVVGGFLVTHRMLHMFKPKRERKQGQGAAPALSETPARPETVSATPDAESASLGMGKGGEAS